MNTVAGMWVEFTYRHCSTYAIIKYRKTRHKSNFAQVGNPNSITLGLMGGSMTALPPVLSPSSILVHFCHIALLFPQGNIRSRFKKCYYFNCLNFFF
jgi:hypothetical protein